MSKRILVVDDDSQLQRLLELALKRSGYEVVQARSGSEAVAQVLETHPDLIIMDIMMPDMNGYEATKRIRRLPEGRHVPVIFLSALSDVEAKVKAFRVGGTDYVTKPVNIAELLERIKAHLAAESLPVGRLLMAFGSKGGIGTTTFLVNLGLTLRGLFPDTRVLLVDWQRPLGDMATFLGLVDPPSVNRLLPVIQELDRNMLQETLVEWTKNLFILAGSTDPQAEEQMNMEALGELLEMSLGLADYVLVDCGAFWQWRGFPWISKDIGANICLITPEITSLRRALYIIEEVSQEEYDFYVVLNREGMAGGMPVRQIKDYLGHRLLGTLPDEPELITKCLNLGKPAVLEAPRSGYVRAMQDIAKQLGGEL